MLEEGLRFPSRGEEALTTVVIGGILTFFAWLIVPGLALGGYALHVLRAADADEEAPPVFEDWAALVVDGIRVLGVTLALGLLVGVAFAVGGTFLGLGASAGRGVGIALAIVGVAILLASALAALAVVYVYPAALAVLAVEGSLTAALSPSRLAAVVLTDDYLVAWLVAAAIWIVGGAIASALMFLVVGVFVQFYVSVAALHVIGRGYRTVTRSGGTGGTGDEPAAAAGTGEPA